MRPGLLEHPGFATRPLRILEFGFGLGTNFLQTQRCLLEASLPEANLSEANTVELYSVESDLSGLEFFLTNSETRSSLPEFELDCLERTLAKSRIKIGAFSVTLVQCDFLTFLKSNACPMFDVVYFDPFSPSSTEACWSKEIFQALGLHLNPQARVVTYSVARSAKDGVEAAGCVWEKRKIPSILNKRSSLLAIKQLIK